MNKKQIQVVIILSIILIVAVVLAVQNAKKVQCKSINPRYCETDTDCICKEKGCFVGGELFWKQCVDKSTMCTDLCPQECSCNNNLCDCTNEGHA